MAENNDYAQGGILIMAENHFDIDRADRVRTTSVNKEFYKKMIEHKVFENMHQLYTFSILVAIYNNAEPERSPKPEEVCHVSNINSDNLTIVKAIVSQKCPEITNGADLLKRMTEYADAGISILRVEYENNGTLRLDNYIE